MPASHPRGIRTVETRTITRCDAVCYHVYKGYYNGCAKDIKRASDSFIGFKTIIDTAYLGTEGRHCSVVHRGLCEHVHVWA